MTRRKALLPTLAAVLLLTACGTGSGEADLLARAAGLDPEERLVTVDGRPVEAEAYLYWLAVTCDSIAAQYQAEGTALDWDEDLSGQTLGDYAKEQALRSAALYATVEDWAETYGCVLTEEDRADMSDDWDAKAQAYGGEAAYLEALAGMGLDRAGAERLCADHYLYRQLYQLSRTEGSALYPAPGAIESYAQEQGLFTVAWMRMPVGEDAEAARVRAGEAFAALNESADPAAAFPDLTEQYGAEGSGQGTFAPGTDALPAVCQDAVQALSEGQWSGIVEAEESFYILLRQPLDQEAAAGGWFDQQLQAAADSAEVEAGSAYRDLDTAAFYDALTQARAELAAGGETAGR